jgi:HSP20 family protein
MFGSLTNYEGNLLDDLRRMQQDMDEMFGPRAWPTGIRSVARGTYPPVNIGATGDRVDVYLFAAGLDPKALDISIQ